MNALLVKLWQALVSGLSIGSIYALIAEGYYITFITTGTLNFGQVSLQTRVGIATGLVVVGDLLGSGEAQERGIVGETPNLAARLQGIAEPNTVVIAESTRKLLGNLFELDDLGARELKGIAGSVRAWAALRIEWGYSSELSGSPERRPRSEWPISSTTSNALSSCATSPSPDWLVLRKATHSTHYPIAIRLNQ